MRENKRGDALGWEMLEVWALAGSLKCWRSQGGGVVWWGWGLSPSTVDPDAGRHPLHNTTVLAKRAPGLVTLLSQHKRQDHHNGGKRGQEGRVVMSKCHVLTCPLSVTAVN